MFVYANANPWWWKILNKLHMYTIIILVIIAVDAETHVLCCTVVTRAAYIVNTYRFR